MRHAHNNHIVESGRYRLHKCTKPQAIKIIKETGQFKGYLAGNRVNPFHIADGWGLGYAIDVSNIHEFEMECERFINGLNIYTPELGSYAHYYRIIE